MPTSDEITEFTDKLGTSAPVSNYRGKDLPAAQSDQYGEHALLALLDGETQIDNVVFVATTNYPERLDQRLVNRPSCFNEIIKIDMPSAAARSVYFRARLKMELSESKLAEWVKDTEGLSIAHLKEIVVAVYCLGRDYSETLKRLKAMRNALKSSSGREAGFGSAVAA